MSDKNYSTANKVATLNHAKELLQELRHTLDLIRAGTPREDMAEAVSAARAPLAMLQAEIEDSIAYSIGWHLSNAVEDIEANAANEGQTIGDEFRTVPELRLASGRTEPRELDRDYRMLGQAWEASCLSDQLELRLERAQLQTRIGEVAAKILRDHYEAVKERTASKLSV